MFVVFTLLVVGQVGLDRLLVSQRDDRREEVRTRWTPAREAAGDLLAGLIDQESGERGFLITGDAEFLASYRRGGRLADSALRTLHELAAGDTGLESDLRRAEDRVGAWRQLGANFEIEAKQQRRDDQVQALVGTGTSKELFDEARVEIAELRQTILDRLDSRQRRVDALEARIAAVRVVTGLFALALVIAGGYSVRRWLTVPLLELTTAARTVAAGALDHPIPSPGPPELAALGRDMEAMRRRILAEVDDATRARSSLAQRGMIVLTLRDELAPEIVDVPASLQIARRFRPSETLVAGDWYEISKVNGDKLFVIVADVSGHGPEAGVFALKTKQLVRIAIEEGLSPAKTWQWVADRLGDTGDQFLTGVIVAIDADTGAFTYSSAGHPPLLLCTGDDIRQLGPTGPIVGAYPGAWSDGEGAINEGGYLVAYSDGLVDAQDSAGEWADPEGLARVLAESGRDVEQVAELCLDYHDRHDARERDDDVTVVVVAKAADH